DNSFFSQWKDIETQYMRLAEESFNPLPIFKVHLFHREMVGREMLQQMADEIFEDKDPSTIFFKKRSMTVQKVNNDYLLTIPLPHSDKKDLDLWVRGDELIITMKNYRRNLLLPRTISALPLKEARFEGDELKIIFGGDEHGKSSS
ncbi:MAG: ArsA family ATPase, partial [Candidatus Aminicenantes bacterium]|nr:ArsA family ATPase [Candidatus Aminicenantes bacterium]